MMSSRCVDPQQEPGSSPGSNQTRETVKKQKRGEGKHSGTPNNFQLPLISGNQNVNQINPKVFNMFLRSPFTSALVKPNHMMLTAPPPPHPPVLEAVFHLSPLSQF